MTADPYGEQFWTREQYRDLAKRYEDQIARSNVGVIRLLEQIDRLITRVQEAESRLPTERANAARRAKAERRRAQVLALAAEGKPAYRIEKLTGFPHRTVQRYLKGT